MSYIGTTPAPQMTEVGTGSVETQDIQDGAVTAAKLAAGAAVPAQTGQSGKFLTTNGTAASWATVQTGVTITSVTYSGDDLAVDPTTPLQCTLTGTGFVAGTVIYIDTVAATNSATAITVVSSTSITFTPPAGKAANNYNVWAVLPTGVMAVLVNGILYSGTPNWSSQATSIAPASDVLNIQLTATGDTPLVYSLVSGTLPTGTTLSSTGLISGTATVEAVYPNIVIRATDPQNQDASVTIQITISLSDPLFKNTTLILSGNPTVTPFDADGSVNNFELIANGDVRSSNFTPYQGEGYYSNYFGGSDHIALSSAPIAATGTFTFECWVYVTGTAASQCVYGQYASADANRWMILWNDTANKFTFAVSGSTSYNSTSTYSANTWHHIAWVRDGSNNLSFYINGVRDSTNASVTTSLATVNPMIGNRGGGGTPYTGYISNMRITNTAVYSGTTYTVPTTPLTNISGTTLLICQSNRFVDNETTPLTLTLSGSPQVAPAQPFTLPSNVATYGSGYFDGSGDTLTTAANAAFAFDTGDFTIEFWAYKTANTSGNYDVAFGTGDSGTGTNGYFVELSSTRGFVFVANGTIVASFAMNPNTAAWNHYAVTRSGSTVRLFVGGSVVASATYSSSIPSTVSVRVGGTDNHFFGYLSDVRVVKGIAVYTTTYTLPTAPLTAISGTSLLTAQYNGTSNNVGFKDSSQNNFVVTRTGNATQGTFTPYGDRWSGYFDGSGDYVTIPSSSSFTFTGDYTWEAWIYPTAASPSGEIISKHLSGVTGWYMLTVETNLKVSFVIWNDQNTSSNAISTNTLNVNAWNHIAGGRNGSNVFVCVNGTYASTPLTVTPRNTDTSINIGANANGSTNFFAGYISNVRAVAAAVYTANYTVPTANFTAIANTRLLTLQNSRLVDNSTNAFSLTRSGDFSIQRFSPFAPTTGYSESSVSGSAYFDGSGDYLTLPVNPAFELGTNACCVEAWVYLTNTNNFGLFATSNNVSGQTRPNFYVAHNQIQLDYFGNVVIQTSTNIGLNCWRHIVFTRASTSGPWRIFVDGVLVAYSAAGSQNLLQTGAAQEIGRLYAGTTGQGYLSNLRVVNGSVPSAYVTSSTTTGAQIFTPPTQPLTAVPNTVLLLNFTNTGIFDRAMINNLETVGNAQVSTNIKKYGTGGLYFDATGDYLAFPSNPNYAFGTGDFTIETWMYTNTLSGGRGFFQLSDTAGGFKTTYTSGILITLSDGSTGAINTNVLGTNVGSAAGVISTGTWYHVAVTRQSGSVRIFLNGTLVGGPTTIAGNISGQNIVVGGYYNTSYLWNGYLDDFRITKGVARYTANFTVPAEHKGR